MQNYIKIIVTAYISVAQLHTGKNVCPLNSAPYLDDVLSQSELTTLF